MKEQQTPESKLKELHRHKSTRGGASAGWLKQIEEVLSSSTQMIEERAHDGRWVERHVVRIGQAQHTIYQFEYWWASSDDADNESEIYFDEQVARWHYARFGPKAPDFPTDYPTGILPFHVRVEQAGRPDRQLWVAERNGRIGKVVQHGLLAPVFLKAKAEAAGLIPSIQGATDEQLDAMWEQPEYLACMFHLGDNGHGYVVVDIEASRLAAKTVRFTDAWCWETGITYYLLKERVPTDVFTALLKDAGLFYHDEQQEEEGDWKAWCTTDRARATEVLARFGWTSNLENL